MRLLNSCYLNICSWSIKLLALLICSFFGVACGDKKSQQILTYENNTKISDNALDLNRSTAAELARLPAIGEGLARRIVEHRSRYGRFRKPEHLMLVPGISEARFRELRPLIKTD